MQKIAMAFIIFIFIKIFIMIFLSNNQIYAYDILHSLLFQDHRIMFHLKALLCLDRHQKEFYDFTLILLYLSQLNLLNLLKLDHSL
jgi:hypothetical protein